MEFIIFFIGYLVLNCLFLSYIRLRDIGKIQQVKGIYVPLFIIYIGVFALPLQAIYWFKNKIIK